MRRWKQPTALPVVFNVAPAWDDVSKQWTMGVKWLDLPFSETDVPEGDFEPVLAVTEARSSRSHGPQEYAAAPAR